MESCLTFTKGIVLLVLLTIIYPPSALYAQGSLTPPGAPTPTMKSLDQIEARTPVDAAHTPGSGTNLFVITQPGSYYLTGSISGVPNKNGINIETNNVTLDLNGFQLNGNGSASLGAIVVGSQYQSAYHGITVCNGTIENWGMNGVEAHCTESKFANLLITSVTLNNPGVVDSGSGGLSVRDRNLVTGCSVNNCPYAYAGIIVLDDSIITDCIANFNGRVGILAFGDSDTITRCTARGNSDIGIIASGSVVAHCTASYNASGISAAGDSTVQLCTALYNYTNGIVTGDGTTVSQCIANGNSSNGIVVGIGCTVINCTARNNTGDGVQFGGKCLITGNNATSNTGNGFHVTGTGTGAANRIDGNMAVSNGGDGILWANDLVVRNSCFLNGVNYSPAVGGGNTGPVQAASTGTNPWANF
jgi:Right handed beta helix region